MKAAVLVGFGGVDQLELREAPEVGRRCAVDAGLT
jgi:hypothetical protein